MFSFKNKKPVVTSRRSTPNTDHSPAFSYYNNRPADASSTKTSNNKRVFHRPPIKGSLKGHLKHLPSYLAVGVIVLSLLYTLGLDNQPRIILGSSSTSDSLLRSSSVYQSAVARMLSQSLLNRTKLTINTADIERQIEKKFPEIQNATVSLPIIGHRPIVGLDPANPSLIIDAHSGNFVLDEAGRALIKVNDIDAAMQPKLPIVQDDSGLTIEQGNSALPKDYVAFITTIIAQLTAKHIKVQTVELPAIVNELHVSIEGHKYYVKFDMSGDARLQAGTYLAVKQKLESQNINPAEYIDVRVNERAYYK